MPRLLILIISLLGIGCRVAGPATNSSPFQQPIATQESLSLVQPATFETYVQAEESGSIEEYVQLGLLRNPSIAAAQHRVEAARNRVPQAIALPDPMLNTNTHLAPIQTAAGEQAFSLGISQKWTPVDRRLTLAAMAADEVAIAQAALEQKRLEVAEAIRKTGYQLLSVRRSIEITNEDLESLQQIAEVVRRQYEVKQSVTQQDVLNVQLEQSRVENQRTSLRQQEQSLQARLSRWIHVDPDSRLTIVDSLTDKIAEFDVDRLVQLAVERRPELRSQMASVRQTAKAVRLARLAAKPDVTFGLNWIATSSTGISPVANGDDSLLLGLGFNLPVDRSRIQAGICEARSNQTAAEYQLVSLQDRANEEVFDIVTQLDGTRETLMLIQEDIIPKAERTLEIAIDGYSTDTIEYVQLIANWRSIYRYRISEASLQAQYLQLLAELARSVGQIDPVTPSAMLDADDGGNDNVHSNEAIVHPAQAAGLSPSAGE